MFLCIRKHKHFRHFKVNSQLEPNLPFCNSLRLSYCVPNCWKGEKRLDVQHKLGNNFTLAAPLLAWRCVGIQPCHDTRPGDSAAEAFSHVCRRTAALQIGQHNGWFLWGHSPQSYPENIWGQGPWHHWWAQSEPSCVCPHSAEKVHSVICFFSPPYHIRSD